MAGYATERARQFYAETYDVCVGDWPGEFNFYRELALEAHARGQSILEIACGTGRIADRLAREKVKVVGLDISPAMLAVAREKSRGLPQIRYVEADMRSFELGETFGLVIIPGHSFQNLVTAEGQVHCLQAIKKHLAPDGVLVVHLDHLDVRWLGSLRAGQGGVFKDGGSFTHPITGARIRVSQAWSFEPVTQTAISETLWEAFDPRGQVTDRWESGPLRFHCLFPFEMDHLLARVGFENRKAYGDFLWGELTADSSDMVWVATPGPSTA